MEQWRGVGIKEKMRGEENMRIEMGEGQRQRYPDRGNHFGVSEKLDTKEIPTNHRMTPVI